MGRSCMAPTQAAKMSSFSQGHLQSDLRVHLLPNGFCLEQRCPKELMCQWRRTVQKGSHWPRVATSEYLCLVWLNLSFYWLLIDLNVNLYGPVWPAAPVMDSTALDSSSLVLRGWGRKEKMGVVGEYHCSLKPLFYHHSLNKYTETNKAMLRWGKKQNSQTFKKDLSYSGSVTWLAVANWMVVWNVSFYGSAITMKKGLSLSPRMNTCGTDLCSTCSKEPNPVKLQQKSRAIQLRQPRSVNLQPIQQTHEQE